MSERGESSSDIEQPTNCAPSTRAHTEPSSTNSASAAHTEPSANSAPSHTEPSANVTEAHRPIVYIESTIQSSCPDASAGQNGTGDNKLLQQLAENEPPVKNDPANVINHDYYDILVIGRTGMGKSSIVNKLLLTRQEPKNKGGENRELEASVDGKNQIKCGNLMALVSSDDLTERENVNDRLKNIVASRSPINKPCTETKDDHCSTEANKSSRNCVLLKNTDTNIRILDPPGFYRFEPMEGATNTSDSNLIIVRQIFHLQMKQGLKFNRILYFLPQNGPLIRSEQALLEEIQQLVKYFGKSIFSHIVIVATMPPHISRDPELPLESKFPQELLDQSKRCFQETLEKAYKQRKMSTAKLPNPPIIFIAMTDTGEEILEKIRTAPVESNSALQLEFEQCECSKCGIVVGINKDNVKVCERRKEGAVPWANAVLYDETYCHPKLRSTGLIPKLPFSAKFKCELCKQKVGTEGCYKVNSVVYCKLDSITVKHSSKLGDEL